MIHVKAIFGDLECRPTETISCERALGAMQTTTDGTSASRQTGAKALVMELLDEHRVLAVSTLRADGWPQTTMVGYVHDGLTVYFAVARSSQKLANIKRDNRVSLALGHRTDLRLRGLSFAGRAEEVFDVAEVDRLNALMRERYPGESPLAPREHSTAVLRVRPEVVSIVEVLRESGRPPVFHIRDGELVDEAPAGERTVMANRGSAQPFYRPGAPL